MTKLAQTLGLTEFQTEIVATVRQFVDKEVIPTAQELEHADTYPQAIVDAMREMAGEINRITVERVQAELDKLMLGALPWEGIDLLVETGIAQHILPEVPALHGWRREVFGDAALALKQGRLALGVDGRRVKLIGAE